MGERTMDPPMAAVILHIHGGQRQPVPGMQGSLIRPSLDFAQHGI